MESAAQYGTSVGIVVRELEPVMEFYQGGLGLGPFELGEIDASAAVWNEEIKAAWTQAYASAQGVPANYDIDEIEGSTHGADVSGPARSTRILVKP